MSAPRTGLTPAAETMLRDFDKGDLHADEHDEIAARLWMVVREATHAAARPEREAAAVPPSDPPGDLRAAVEALADTVPPSDPYYREDREAMVEDIARYSTIPSDQFTTLEEFAATVPPSDPPVLALNDTNGPWCGCGQPLGHPVSNVDCDPLPSDPPGNDLRAAQLAEFMGWLFRDGGLEPPRREYDAVEQRLRLLMHPPSDPTICEVCGALADGEPGRCHLHFRPAHRCYDEAALAEANRALDVLSDHHYHEVYEDGTAGSDYIEPLGLLLARLRAKP